MLFNSIDFAIFLPLVFLLYWFAANRILRQQNALLLLASYVFYGWWDWRFLFLLLFSSLVDYFVGLALAREENKNRRKLYLLISIFANLGLLGFFKYFNFFIENFAGAFRLFGLSIHPETLHIILPVGISFYTFQSLSYGIDVYRRKLQPTRDLIAFLAFVSFFPQLVAGPIERATHLLPQFFSRRSFKYEMAKDGLRQILWGLFKKMLIADTCGQFADIIFNHSTQYGGSTLLLGTFFFAIQIYGDFSGYSDIAVGTARLFGFDLMSNFSYPYFSRNPAEFWRRWHISLSSWFRDYVYIPLGGNKKSRPRRAVNASVTFLLSGLWHGAHWKYLAWGGLHALYYLPFALSGKKIIDRGTLAAGRYFPSLKELAQVALTFLLVLMAWVLFRANNFQEATLIYREIFSVSLFQVPAVLPRKIFAFLFFFFILEWLGREQPYAIANTGKNWPVVFRWLFYYVLIFLLLAGAGREQPFIYFQF